MHRFMIIFRGDRNAVTRTMGSNLTDSAIALLTALRDLERPALNATRGSASVDFCESNYALDDGLAEAFATAASLGAAALALGGAGVAYTHNLETRMTMLWTLGAWWGVGTALMVSERHCSLERPGGPEHMADVRWCFVGRCSTLLCQQEASLCTSCC